MANELALSVSLTYTPTVANQFKVAPPTFTKSVSITAADGANIQGTQELSTVEAALRLPVSGFTTTGYVFIKNLSTTETVQVGLTGSFPLKLLPSEFCLFRANGTIFVKSSSGTPVIQYLAFEE